MKTYVIHYMRGNGMSEGLSIITDETKQGAVLRGAKLCRKQNELPSGTHLSSKILFESEDSQHAQWYFEEVCREATTTEDTQN